jgi:DNA repair ATPase RecN
LIEEILIKDFQNHRTLRLVLGRVTVLVGDNGTGKSAVLRALRWLMTNQPLGEGFIGRWRKAPYSFVKAKIDGRWVARKKGKGVNQYRLDGKVLKAFKTKPPQAVSDLCNVSDLNFQRQTDASFGLSLNGSDAAKLLNTVVNLGAIDQSLKIAASKVRTAKARLDVCLERLKEARAGRAANAWAVQLSTDIERFEQRIAQMAVAQRRCSRIDDLLAAVGEAYDAQDRAAAVKQAALRAASAGRLERATRQLVARLEDTVQAITTARARLRPVPSAAKLTAAWTARKTTAAEVSKIECFLFGLENQKWERERCQRKVKSLIQELAGLTSRQRKCEACGQPLPGSGSRPVSQTFISPTQSPAAAPRRERSGTPYRRNSATS